MKGELLRKREVDLFPGMTKRWQLHSLYSRVVLLSCLNCITHMLRTTDFLTLSPWVIDEIPHEILK